MAGSSSSWDKMNIFKNRFTGSYAKGIGDSNSTTHVVNSAIARDSLKESPNIPVIVLL